MKSFADDVTKPFIQEMGYRQLCEVGAQFGENTGRMLELPGVHVTVVDPCLDADLAERMDGSGRVDMRKGLSLEVLPQLEGPFDCILLDGDHNWYTVFHELKEIHGSGLLVDGGTILVHDVAWPYARRDMYFQPETVPEAYRQPCARKGIVPGQPVLAEEGGVNADLCNAVREGGPRNGVLTAVEDFLGEHGSEYTFRRLELQYGLGFLFRKGHPERRVAFERFHRQLDWKLRLGKVKDFVQDRWPWVYDAARALHDRLSR